MTGNGTLLHLNQVGEGTSGDNQINDTPNSVQQQTTPFELLSHSGKSVDTIGLEAALKLLPAKFSGAN